VDVGVAMERARFLEILTTGLSESPQKPAD